MHGSTVHIFWNAPIGKQHLALWLERLGFVPVRQEATLLCPGHLVFIGFPPSELPEIPPEILRIGAGRPLKDSPFFLKTPIAPRALAHMLSNLRCPEKIMAYLPGVPSDFLEILPWLDTLTRSNADIHLPELFQYIDSKKADVAILPLLTDKIQALLEKKPNLILLGLEQGKVQTRTLCARMAGKLALEEALPLLLTLLDRDCPAEEKETLIRALACFAHPEARIRLHREALGMDTLRSLAAIESLDQDATDADIALLDTLIAHPEALRAAGAAETLARIGSPRAYQALAHHLHPEDPLVRKTVTALLIRGGDPALAAILPLMRETGVQERINGSLILGNMGRSEALDGLCEQLRHTDANVRFSACEALGKLDTEATFFPLSAALDDPNQAVVCAAISGLNQRHPQTGTQALRQAISAHPDRYSTLVAAVAAMQATTLFLGLSQDRKLARDIVLAAAQSRNLRLLHRFLEACSRIVHTGTRRGCEALLKRAIEDIPPNRPRILVTDDSSTMRRFYETLLPQYGYAVETARDGLDALSRLKPDPDRFALVLTDLNMPNKNGIELTRELREELGLTLPVLMVSTETVKNQEKAAQSAGISAFLKKPFTAEALVEKLRILIP